MNVFKTSRTLLFNQQHCTGYPISTADITGAKLLSTIYSASQKVAPSP